MNWFTMGASFCQGINDAVMDNLSTIAFDLANMALYEQFPQLLYLDLLGTGVQTAWTAAQYWNELCEAIDDELIRLKYDGNERSYVAGRVVGTIAVMIVEVWGAKQFGAMLATREGMAQVKDATVLATTTGGEVDAGILGNAMGNAEYQLKYFKEAMPEEAAASASRLGSAERA